jgi:two-component system sensor histidine kinase HydH
MAAILLLLACSGIVFLLLAQGYRSTRASLSRVQAFSGTLVEHMPIGLVALDARWNIVIVNPEAEALFGEAVAGSVGASALDRLPEPVLEVVRAADAAAGAVEQEVRCSAGAGGDVPMEVGCSRLTDENGGALGFVILLKDLTELRFLRKEVERNRRLATVGRLAAGVAHEIRNPLSSVKGFATYFKERYREIPEDQEIVRIMIGEVDRINRVVGQLLDFSRPVTLSRKPTDLQTLLRDSLKQVESQARAAHCPVELSIPGSLPLVNVDTDRIRQVLLNLYLNALEAMAAGGRLTVSAAAVATGKEVTVRVSDTGSGIGPDQLPHIFDPYFTTKSTGTGLGLAIAHNIMEAHGGSIAVDSRPGGGSVVTLSLPAAEREASPKGTAEDLRRLQVSEGMDP